MNGDKVFLDTNAFIYFFEGRAKITALVVHTPTLYFSPITEIELLSAPHLSLQEREQIKEFLALCERVDLSEKIIAQTIVIRQQYRFKVPDAIIAASALTLNIALVSADVAFQKITGLALVSDILS